MPKNAPANLDPDPDFTEQILSNQVAPERRLLAAMLSTAILDYCSERYVSIDDRHNARRWLFCKCPEGTRITFEFCCSELDLDPLEIRRTIKKLELDGIPWVARRY